MVPKEEEGHNSKGLEGDCLLDSEKDPPIGDNEKDADIFGCSSDTVSDLALDKLSILPCTNREEEASSSYCISNRDRQSSQNSYGVYTEDARQCDHILLGQQQELFFCHELSPGSWFFLPHATRVYNKLMAFIKKEYWKRGYTEVMSPNMYNMKLWETSGHAANEKENMFTFDVDKQEFGLKHVNCPGHCLLFQQRVRSCRDWLTLECYIKMRQFELLLG
ncbi:threonine--tRNA ligase, mitochondrial 1-like [Arabidopsis lyrata subsp. lyrata]|uniref:threonine--tRNA ligase, mitochondrial 1-like n=1 Tax=Arabidopsis lyrata subsp. lyrata TaxID=81972 RepID=UPI000A29CA10|nr:threonine--tRNA ligase, mitochondrial 1-like [Arabidopsis lyrata subsp. lyrata]|eukprot:XP_020869722.1 threonine--tRNA ligase, mitochondrial 1-like [Arabidopsis lyrata subsp. lyrata]